MARSSLRVGGTGERAGCGAQLGDYRGADFAGHSWLVEVGQKQPSQTAGRHFAGEVGVVDLASQAVPPLPRGSFEPVLATSHRSLCGFLAGGAGQLRAVVRRSRTRGIEHARPEVGYGMFDDAGTKIIHGSSGPSRPVSIAIACSSIPAMVVKPVRQPPASVMQEAGGILGSVDHLKI